MKFHLLNRFFNLGCYSKPALLVLTITLIVTGGLLIGGGATVQDKFKMTDATTTEANGKQIRAKAGFELVKKGEKNIVARRVSKSTMSSDSRTCMCSNVPSDGTAVCHYRFDGPTAVCGGLGSDACCKWVSTNK